MNDGYDYFLAAAVEQHYQRGEERELAYVAAVEHYFTQQYEEDEDVAQTKGGVWNAEKQAYADCEGCHGKGWFDNGAVIVEPCNVCLPRRIAELEAALRPFADAYTTYWQAHNSSTGNGLLMHWNTLGLAAEALGGVEGVKHE